METNILEIPFNALSFEQTITQLENWLAEPQNHVIVTPNPEAVMQARRNANFSKALKSADLRLADGVGILLASRFKREPLPSRVRGYDVTIHLFERLNATEKKFTAYFLGAAQGVAEAAKKAMEEKYPHLTVVGLTHGFFSDNSDEEALILSEINRLSPDILLVCLGMPRAEIWATTHRNINTRLTLCVGGTMDVMAGNVQLAPAFMRRIGLEWLYRLSRQPSRAKRMLDIPRFMFAVVLDSIGSLGRGRS
jgi:N-acetylglucosaminyldiphosphoundecaprenol N-acetyl-beta-D-mannosaminyltransferase